jgi:hypothetical protein
MTRGWPAWWEKYGGDNLVSVIPYNAESDTIPKALRGKVPGTRKDNGKWVGTTGSLADRQMTFADAQKAHRTGAAIGMLGRKFPALDIDTNLPALAQEVQGLAEMILGSAPCRGREGSPRRLLMYRGNGLRRRRIEFRPPWWKKGDKLDAIEVLGDGQYYNIEGIHPSGKPYTWTEPAKPSAHPCDWPEIEGVDDAAIDMLFEALPAAIAKHECVLGRAGSGAARGSASAQDKPLSDPSLWHPDGPAPVLAAMAADKDDYDYDGWVEHAFAFKAALGPDREDHYGAFEDWSAQSPVFDVEKTRKLWDSIETSRLDWRYLNYPPEIEFADAPPEVPDVADPGTVARETMFSRYAYVLGSKRFFNVETREGLDPDQFCSVNVLVAPYGRSGERSADAIYLNDRRARKLSQFTYRPGAPAIVGAEANTWQKGGLEPIVGAVPAPWLEHVAEMIPDEAQRNHFLDWCAFVLQRPGEKINHAVVLYTANHGAGKDSLLAPLFSGVGASNWQNVPPETLCREFTGFLEKQLIYVPEVKNFTKGEFYNFTKRVLAAPPETVSVRKMRTDAYDIPNIQNWIMTTNAADAIRLEADDRRYWIADCVGHDRADLAYYDRLWGFLDDKDEHGRKRDTGRKIAMGWLLARNVSRFRPFDAPMTDAKREMIDQAGSAPLRWCRDALREGGKFEDRKIVAAREIVDAAEKSRSNASREVNMKWALAALKAEGFTSLERMRDGKDLWRLWVRNPLLAQLPKDELVERYRAEVGLAGWEEVA